jgi:hypothetical protein
LVHKSIRQTPARMKPANLFFYLEVALTGSRQGWSR